MIVENNEGKRKSLRDQWVQLLGPPFPTSNNLMATVEVFFSVDIIISLYNSMKQTLVILQNT